MRLPPSPEDRPAFIAWAARKNRAYVKHRRSVYAEVATILDLPPLPEKPEPGELDLMDEELG